MERSSILDVKKILLDKVMVHAVPKQVTTNPLMSTAHWLHSDRCTAQCTVCLQPCDASRQPQDYQAAKLIAPCSLVTQSLLQLENLCTLSLDYLYVLHWELPVESIPRNDRFFYRGKGSCTTSPLFQPCKAGCTVAYMKGYAEGDSDTAASPNTPMTLEIAKVIIIINKVQCSHKSCRTTAAGSKWVTGI